MAINTNIADYFSQIESLTKTNLEILKTINDSFFTKHNHLFAEVNDTTYVIPSFISLENKINMLQENFQNLVKSPETCEAHFNIDGNTRAIEVKKYNYAPDSVNLNDVTSFSVMENDIFKDFVTPKPFINFNLPTLTNDISEVNVKKIVAKSEGFKKLLKEKLSYIVTETIDGKETPITKYQTSYQQKHSTIEKLLINYKKDVDYIEYDTIHKLPTRKNIGNATYVIESIVSDSIDKDTLEETFTLKLRNDLKDEAFTNNLTYKLFDETIEKPLAKGDFLVNYDGTGKVEIEELSSTTNTIVVKVVNGEYLNFVGTDSYDTNGDKDIHDMSKLRFYSAVDFNSNKTLKVPLEEDQYIYVAVAPVNSRMNLQGSWGTGLVIDTYSLSMNNGTKFNEYYNDNVKNIGEVLYEMTAFITAPITSLPNDAFKSLSSIKPTISEKDFSVMHINKHLNDSENVKNIRDAYNQKKKSELELQEIQSKINDINSKISSIVFDDTIGTRNMYTSQLAALNDQKNSILTSISNSINSISMNANSSEIPIENAKYRIRGFCIPKLETIAGIDGNEHIVGIKVQYRYKNVSSQIGTAVSINVNNNTYIYSDWNTFRTELKSKIAEYNESTGKYVYKYEQNNEDKNEPSYNQIDIPISQGETVDIRIKVIYDFGQPYVTMTSDWSNIINIGFPVEFSKDVPILTIIEENNNDIETNRFNNILETTGVTSHINDSIVDQNITFYHKPDNIASGFYTEERRIIPLKDKLVSLSNEIAQLKSDITGTGENCYVSVISGDANTVLYSDRENTIILEPYDIISQESSNGNYNTDKDGVVSTILNISITNTGNTTLKLYSLFPGTRDTILNNLNKPIFKLEHYIVNDSDNNKQYGIGYKYQTNDAKDSGVRIQTANQFITFRKSDVWNGTDYYTIYGDNITQKLVEYGNMKIDSINSKDEMLIYPFVNTKYGLCMDSNDVRTYFKVDPQQEIIIPMYCEYKLISNDTITKTISFDLRTSLYSDPVNYTFKVTAKKSNNTADKLINVNKNKLMSASANLKKYNHVFK